MQCGLSADSANCTKRDMAGQSHHQRREPRRDKRSRRGRNPTGRASHIFPDALESDGDGSRAVAARRATERSIVEPKVLWLNPANLDKVIKVLASEADEFAHLVIADS